MEADKVTDARGSDRTLRAPDVISGEEIQEAQKDTRALKCGRSNGQRLRAHFCQRADYWSALASHNLKTYRLEEIQVSIPMKCAVMINGVEKLLVIGN